MEKHGNSRCPVTDKTRASICGPLQERLCERQRSNISVEERSQPKCSNSSLWHSTYEIAATFPSIVLYVYSAVVKILPIFFVIFCLSPTQRIRTVQLCGSHSSATLSANGVVKSHPFGAKGYFSPWELWGLGNHHIIYKMFWGLLERRVLYRGRTIVSTCMSHTYTAFSIIQLLKHPSFPNTLCIRWNMWDFSPSKPQLNSTKETTKCLNITLKIHTPIWSQSKRENKAPELLVAIAKLMKKKKIRGSLDEQVKNWRITAQANSSYGYQFLTRCPDAVYVFLYIFSDLASIQDDTTAWPTARKWQVK